VDWGGVSAVKLPEALKMVAMPEMHRDNKSIYYVYIYIYIYIHM